MKFRFENKVLPECVDCKIGVSVIDWCSLDVGNPNLTDIVCITATCKNFDVCKRFSPHRVTVTRKVGVTGYKYTLWDIENGQPHCIAEFANKETLLKYLDTLGPIKLTLEGF